MVFLSMGAVYQIDEANKHKKWKKQGTISPLELLNKYWLLKIKQDMEKSTFDIINDTWKQILFDVSGGIKISFDKLSCYHVA